MKEIYVKNQRSTKTLSTNGNYSYNCHYIGSLDPGLLSIPVFAEAGGFSWVLVFTCVALLLIAFGNGLFKGNLQAIVGQMYDNFEAEAAKNGPEALAEAKSKRDSGFQIFYVFINIGGVIAPFIAPLLRSWWLKAQGLAYQADLPRLCHKFIENKMEGNDINNLTELAAQVGNTGVVDSAFCTNYLHVFNTGVHFSFIASVAAMLISLIIFLAVKKKFPNPAKKEKKEVEQYTQEELQANAKEIKQRMYALFAVLGVAVFFWFSFHQNLQVHIAGCQLCRNDTHRGLTRNGVDFNKIGYSVRRNDIIDSHNSAAV